MKAFIYFPYYGAKYRMIKAIRKLICEATKAIIEKHEPGNKTCDLKNFEKIVTVDCFGGSGVITINRPIVIKKAVLNEYNPDVMLLHKLMAGETRQGELIERLKKLKYGKSFFEEAKKKRAEGFIGCDEMQKAEIMYTLLTQSFNACMDSWQWGKLERQDKQEEYTKKIKNRLAHIKDRYKGVIVENMDAFELIKKYINNPYVILLLDPPYFPKTRTAKKVYGKGAFELSINQHKKLLKLIRNAKCKVILFGYWDSLYNNKLSFSKENNWCSFELMDVALSCQHSEKNGQKDREHEWVWTNFEPKGLAMHTIIGLRKHYQITKNNEVSSF